MSGRLLYQIMRLALGSSRQLPAQARNRIWARICARDAATRTEIRETGKALTLKATGGIGLAARPAGRRFYHLIVIHRWGWTLVLNPDGTTTAWNPDRTKVLHSHSPPARAG